MSFVALNIAPLFWKQSAFVLLLGTYVTLPSLIAPSATALQQDVSAANSVCKSTDVFSKSCSSLLVHLFVPFLRAIDVEVLKCNYKI
jgi:hypothetical protein